MARGGLEPKPCTIPKAGYFRLPLVFLSVNCSTLTRDQPHRLSSGFWGASLISERGTWSTCRNQVYYVLSTIYVSCMKRYSKESLYGTHYYSIYLLIHICRQCKFLFHRLKSFDSVLSWIIIKYRPNMNNNKNVFVFILLLLCLLNK